MAHRSSNSRSYYKSEISRSNDDDYYRGTSRRHRERSRSRSRSRSVRRRNRSRSRSAKRSYRRRSSHSRSRSGGYSRESSRRAHRHRSRSRSRSRSYRRRYKSRTRSTSRDRRHKNRTRSRSNSPSDKHRHERSRSASQQSQSRSRLRDYQDENSLQSTTDQMKMEEMSESSVSSSMKIELPDSSGSNYQPSSSLLPKIPSDGAYCNLNVDDPIDKEKIHKEIEERLRRTLAKEGKIYPPPKAEPSHPVFANDGSFLEIFKKMQEQQSNDPQIKLDESLVVPATPAPSTSTNIRASGVSAPPPQLPVFGRRRGGKILKTGVVAKPKVQNEVDGNDPKDFWALYLREVNKYKNSACDADGKTRPLVK